MKGLLRRTLILVFAAFLVIAIALLLRWSGDEGSSVEVQAALDPSTSHDADTEDARRRDQDDQPERSSVRASEALAPYAQSIPVQPVRDGQWRLRIRESDGIHPIAGATVWWLCLGNPWESNEADLLLDPAALVRSLGARHDGLKSDDAGWVVLPCWPRVEGTIAVLASAGSRTGLLVVEREEEPPETLVLAGVPELSVRVVDEHGAPVSNVPVALRMRYGEWATDHGRVETSPQGSAVLACPAYLIQLEPRPRWTVAVLGVFAPPLELELDRDRLPVAPITFVLPPTGTVEVLVLESDGEPCATPIEVTLCREGEGGFRPIREHDLAYKRRGPRAFSVQGRALFPRVGCGLALEAAAGGIRASNGASGKGVGPRMAGERATLTLTLGSDYSVLVARAVDGAGRALVKERLTTKPMVDWNVRTDEHGNLRCDLLPALSEYGNDRELVLVRPARDRLPALFARVHVELQPGVQRRGDVVFGPAPLLVSGVVLDEQGVPIPGVLVRAKRSPQQDGREVSAVSAAQGRFEIRGAEDWNDLEVGTVHPTRRAAPIHVPRGTTGLALVVHTTFSLAGRVLLDPGVPVTHLVLGSKHVVSAAGVTVPLGRDGRFVLRGLAAGLHDVTLRFSSAGEPLRTVQGVEAGKAPDPRLDPIDLRGVLHVYSIALSSADGRPIRGADVIAFPVGADPDEVDTTSTRVSNGRGALASPHARIDCVIEADGYRAVELTDVRDRIEAVLTPELRVRLRFRLPSGGAPPKIQPLLTLVADDEQEAGWNSAWTDAEGESVVRLQAPGRWRVAYRVALENGEIQALPAVAPTIIDVEESDDEPTFVVVVDPGAPEAKGPTPEEEDEAAEEDEEGQDG